ncbi:MAG: universal stress protein [Acidobacteria bacterium]|nr:universal stress protein [Acidobacteriota bacterium]
MGAGAYNGLVVHPLGTLLAILFAALMAVLLLWMFRVPAPLTMEVAHARRSVSGISRILVPTRGTAHDQRATELACRLGQEQRSQIIVTYVVEVPLTLSLGTQMPEEETRAEEAVQRSAEIVKAHNLEAITRIERDRDAGRGILRVAGDLDADLVVVGMDPERSHFADPLGRTIETLLRRGNFEVIVDKHPSSQAA